MPFSSKSQQRFMFAKHPKLAEEFASETPSIKKLPEHVKMAEGGEVKKIDQDNKHYLFKPGKDGSLTVPGENKPKKLVEDLQHTAKVIGPEPEKVAMAPQKMADGGMAGDLSPEEMKQMGLYLTPQNAPMQSEGSMPNVPRGTMTASHETQTPAMPVPMDTGAADEDNGQDNQNERIKDSNPGHSADDLANYVKGQETQIDQYGPEQEKSVMQSIMNQQGSFGNRLARGASGLGDAIMGVAGKQGPGFLNNLENRENMQTKMAAESIPTLQKMNAEQMAAKERLQGMTGTTPIGQAKIAFLKPLVMKLFPGKSDGDYQAMLQNPDEVAKMIGIPAEVYKSEVEARIKGQELGLQGKRADIEEKRLEGEIANQKIQRELEERGKNIQSAEDITKVNPLLPQIMGGVSSKQRQKALGTLSDGGNMPSHGIPDLGSTFNGHKVIGVKRIK